MKRIFPFALALAVVLSLAACSGGKDTTAATMHLRRTEGTVSVSDGGGKDVPVLENLGLYSGYGVGTRPASYAWIDLDEVKLTKLDQNSVISIEKEGKALNIELKSGSLFFNVTQPLEDDETMNIRASTMLVGIRGTCGWVEFNDGLSRVYLLEGKVECSAEGRTVQVNAGEFAQLTADGELVVKEFSKQDLPVFVQDEVDPDLAGGHGGFDGPDETPGPGKTPGPDDMYVHMQSVAGWDVQEALRLLRDEMGLAVDVQEEFSDTVTQGCVIRFSPMEGLLVEKGDTVTIWVSKGPEPSATPDQNSDLSPGEFPEERGKAGDNVKWAFYRGEALLIIEGEGPMKDFDTAPWYKYRSDITKVVIRNGVTSIGNAAFCDCHYLAGVTIPNSVTSIGDEAFRGCNFNLTSVTIPVTVNSIGSAAFYDCDSLTDIYYGGGESQWNQISGIEAADIPTDAAIRYNS